MAAESCARGFLHSTQGVAKAAAMADPIVLLDDARAAGASPARLYRRPQEIVVARRPDEVGGALQKLDVLRNEGAHLAGWVAYEAGLALEPRLAHLARSGAVGPLVWFGVFDSYEELAADEVPGWLAAHSSGNASLGPLEPQLSEGAYQAAFATLREAIAAGDIYQANLTLPLAGSFSGDPLALYAALRPAAAAGYGGVVHDGSHWLLSFSPELFFAVQGGKVTVRPMKGTRPRGPDPIADERLAADLAQSSKDRAENLMIVDLMRNDLSRVAVPGSVRVEAPFTIESYPTVHQMVSTISGRLAPGWTGADLLRALFPCGSITGTPKIRAMELIAEVERDSRGPYCGAAFNVAIRTLRLTPGEGEANVGGRAVLGVGSAIVADSDVGSEWRECMVKGGFVRQATASFDLIESMLFTPEEGIALLELHLERIKASAAEFGFEFDRHAARNAIQALCFELETAAKVRLLLSRTGATSLVTEPLSSGTVEEPVVCGVLSLPVDTGDWRLRHKTTDRGFYDRARAVAQAAGAGEALFIRDDGLVTEASRSNVFIRRGDQLVTPPADLGLLPGVLRRSLVESGRAVEGEVRLSDLADGFLLGNSVRGLVVARLLG
jgi:para-aminobenzoate synthetase / 4-amino-4-deoxychorismate lyase